MLRFNFLIALSLFMLAFVAPNAAADCGRPIDEVYVCDDDNGNGTPDRVLVQENGITAQYHEVPEYCWWTYCYPAYTYVNADAYSSVTGDSVTAQAYAECDSTPGKEGFACGDSYHANACTNSGWGCDGVGVSVWKYEYMEQPDCLVTIAEAGIVERCGAL